MSNQNNIPHLRFKGFEADWQTRKLGELTEKIGDGLHGTPIFSDDSDIYFINGNNLTNGKIEITEKTKKVDYSIFKKNDKGLNENTILISLNGTIGNIAKYNNEKVMLGKSVGYYKFKEKTDFYYHIFHTDKIQNFFISELTGSTIKNLSLKTLRETIIPFPTLPEQQKIASFLSAVDEKTQQLSRKKELLEQYKKGVMQQLFSGKLRFKDENGEDYADWEDKKLGEIAKIAMGQSPDSKSYNTDSKGILLIQGNADIKDRITIPRQWTSEPTKTCEIGDLILTVRAPVGSIAKSLHNACIGRGVCSITNNKNSIQEYLYQFFLSYESKWIGLEQGSTFTAVSGSDIKGLKLNLPSLPEQQKIANFLSGIDAKIENVGQEINAMQGFKKGLLQQLFV